MIKQDLGASEQLPALNLPQTLRGLLEGKVAIVTGASKGIGAATVAAFAEAGAKVVLAARNEKALELVAANVNAPNKDLLVVQTDVTDSQSVERLVSKTLDKYGRLDIAFNNAGDGHMPAPLAEIEL